MTLAEALEIGYRRRKTFAWCFVTIFLGAILAAILMPRHYESEMKILIHRERADTLVTGQQTAAVEQNLPSLTEEDINSEVAILTSEDLLENVVRTCGLQYRSYASPFDRLLSRLLPKKKVDDATAVREAAASLASRIHIEPIKKSFIISVTYTDRDPQFAAHVLNTLGALYQEKHAAVYRPGDAFVFFDNETTLAKQKMDEAEQRLADFNRAEGLVTEQPENESTVAELGQFELSMHQAQAAIPEMRDQLASLEQLLESTPPRITTQEEVSDNGALMQQLKSSLVNLEQQRVDLRNKYAPQDRMVQEVDTQIAQVKAAIASQEKAPLRQQSTDDNPTYEFIRQEIAKTRAQLASEEALAASSKKVDQSYRQAMMQTDQKQLEQQALVNDEKAAENTYLLYVNKREEARISNAFDKSRILNVAIAQKATVPFAPSNPASLLLAVGWAFACLISASVVFVQEKLDAPFRTVEQVERYLDVPVVQYLPESHYGPPVSTH
ncbi:MAG TPA: hypothetical protein VMU43_10355 [Candidatus Acidoferrum sp.]|nr:hypothetical protein [Candidatus Acidoferrum sp.]